MVYFTTRFGFYFNSFASQGAVSAIPAANFNPAESDELFKLSEIPNLLPTLPYTPTVALNPADDTGVLGDNTTSVARPHLTGVAFPNLRVELMSGSDTVLASAISDPATGAYELQVPFDLMQTTTFTVRQYDESGDFSTSDPITIVPVAPANPGGTTPPPVNPQPPNNPPPTLPATGGTEEAKETGNSLDSAQLVERDEAAKGFTGTISGPNDKDFFKIYLYTGERLSVTSSDTWKANDFKGGLRSSIDIFNTQRKKITGHANGRRDSFTWSTPQKANVDGFYYVAIDGVGKKTSKGEYTVTFAIEPASGRGNTPGGGKFCDLRDPTNKKVHSFIDSHFSDASTIAKSLDVPVEFILGLSGHETGYGTNNLAIRGNNFFSIHGEVPGSTGSFVTTGGQRVSVFPSYLASGEVFIRNFGDLVRGKKTPMSFAQGLVPKFNTAKKATGGNPDFIKDVIGGIKAITDRSKC